MRTCWADAKVTNRWDLRPYARELVGAVVEAEPGEPLAERVSRGRAVALSRAWQ